MPQIRQASMETELTVTDYDIGGRETMIDNLRFAGLDQLPTNSADKGASSRLNLTSRSNPSK